MQNGLAKFECLITTNGINLGVIEGKDSTCLVLETVQLCMEHEPCYEAGMCVCVMLWGPIKVNCAEASKPKSAKGRGAASNIDMGIYSISIE
jgi:hypothetical protein